VKLALYMDVHVPAAITRALRRRGFDVLTAQEDGRAMIDDPALLDRASILGRVVFSRDRDFLAEAVRRQWSGLPFGTVVYAHQQHVSIGRCIEDLALIASALKPDEASGQLIFLPL
jgi:predicted nuclease of predicted toxin-antitoxin system